MIYYWILTALDRHRLFGSKIYRRGMHFVWISIYSFYLINRWINSWEKFWFCMTYFFIPFPISYVQYKDHYNNAKCITFWIIPFFFVFLWKSNFEFRLFSNDININYNEPLFKFLVFFKFNLLHWSINSKYIVIFKFFNIIICQDQKMKKIFAQKCFQLTASVERICLNGADVS